MSRSEFQQSMNSEARTSVHTRLPTALMQTISKADAFLLIRVMILSAQRRTAKHEKQQKKAGLLLIPFTPLVLYLYVDGIC